MEPPVYRLQLHYKQTTPQILRFLKYAPNSSHLKNSFLVKSPRCKSVLIKLRKLNISEKALKILMYLQENVLDGSSFSL